MIRSPAFRYGACSGGDPLGVLLVVLDGEAGEEEDEGGERRDAEAAGTYDRVARDEHDRPEDDREVARGPGRRDLRGDERDDDRHGDHGEQRGDLAPLLRPFVPHDPAESRAADEHECDVRRIAADDGARAEEEVVEARARRPRRARVPRLRQRASAATARRAPQRRRPRSRTDAGGRVRTRTWRRRARRRGRAPSYGCMRAASSRG